ncbi:MAG: carbon starvation protein A [Bacteroidetes bacterium]|nr:carbon starvation protein A [Bacteroidota bacterium]
MNAALFGILSAVWFIIMYKWYGGFIERKLISVNDAQLTPSTAMRDNVDYVPAQPAILFGHHFSSIAGAGPIVGPMLAYSLFGWLPALLWIILGSVFIGAVHDYVSLMVSVRNKGISISVLSEKYVSSRARWIFSVFLWLALILVMAVFAVLTAQTLVEKPEIVIPTFGLIFLAIIFGFLVYKRGFNIWIGTVCAITVVFGLILLGDSYPVYAGFDFWLIIILLYSLIASTIPVWILLQPRDYISMYILIIGLALAFVSLIIMHPPINGPAFQITSSNTMPLWPMLFITVACGAVSGFHSVVSSGTSAKQLRRESDGKIVAFGSMLTEAFLAVIVIILISSVLFWKETPFPELSGYIFNDLLAKQGVNITFGTALGRAMESIGIPLQYGIAFGVLMLNAFILTTLDTCARLGRYVLSETIGEKAPFLKNKILATVISLGIAYLLIMGNNWRVLWPVFGAANQLIAALSLLVVSAYIFGFKKKTRYTLIPGIFMLITTEAALLYQLFWQYIPESNIVLSVLSFVLMILGIIIAFEVYKQLRKRTE